MLQYKSTLSSMAAGQIVKISYSGNIYCPQICSITFVLHCIHCSIQDNMPYCAQNDQHFHNRYHLGDLINCAHMHNYSKYRFPLRVPYFCQLCGLEFCTQPPNEQQFLFVLELRAIRMSIAWIAV